MTLWKVHHGIMKSDAVSDFNLIKKFCQQKGYTVFEPKGQHWHRVEDASGEMIRQLTIAEMDSLDLIRGVDYYCDLQNIHKIEKL